MLHGRLRPLAAPDLERLHRAALRVLERTGLQIRGRFLLAAFMKTYRQMAFGSTVSHSLPLGLLDNGAVFSPAQAMLDPDASRAMHTLARGLTVNEETLAMEAIEEVGCGGHGAHLETEHTLRHFRQVGWDSLFSDRSYQRAEALSPLEADRRLLERADQAWRRIAAQQEPVEQDPAFAREVNAICDAARRELLGAP
ncbi:MAG: trimethylamine methyltransferase family protein [Candidatus Latescibacterota bacterium]